MSLRPGYLSMPLLVVAPIRSGGSSISGRCIGSPGKGEKIGGLPIPLDRGRYLKVTHVTVTYAVLTGRRTSVAEGSGDNEKQTITEDLAVSVEHDRAEILTEVVTIPELFAIDVTRPAAGTIDYGIEFADGRAYPKRLKGMVEDKTLEIIRDALGKHLEQVPKPEAAAPTGGRAEGEAQVVRLKESVNRVEPRDLATLDLVATLKP